MYICKNCGQRYMTDEAVMCVNCQAPKGMGDQFCPCCGSQVMPSVRICQNCGVDVVDYGYGTSNKSKVAAGVLGIFLGCYGVHNFYLGYMKKGFIQLGCLLGSIAFIFVISIVMGVAEASYNEGATISAIILSLADIALILGIRIWAFVEGIMILCGKINRDGKGLLLRS